MLAVERKPGPCTLGGRRRCRRSQSRAGATRRGHVLRLGSMDALRNSAAVLAVRARCRLPPVRCRRRRLGALEDPRRFSRLGCRRLARRHAHRLYRSEVAPRCCQRRRLRVLSSSRPTRSTPHGHPPVPRSCSSTCAPAHATATSTRSHRTAALTNLARTPKRDEAWPAWSPDGTRIVFTRIWNNGASADLITVGADGSGAQRVTDTTWKLEGSPQWSPA